MRHRELADKAHRVLRASCTLTADLVSVVTRVAISITPKRRTLCGI